MNFVDNEPLISVLQEWPELPTGRANLGLPNQIHTRKLLTKISEYFYYVKQKLQKECKFIIYETLFTKSLELSSKGTRGTDRKS